EVQQISRLCSIHDSLEAVVRHGDVRLDKNRRYLAQILGIANPRVDVATCGYIELASGVQAEQSVEGCAIQIDEHRCQVSRILLNSLAVPSEQWRPPRVEQLIADSIEMVVRRSPMFAFVFDEGGD